MARLSLLLPAVLLALTRVSGLAVGSASIASDGHRFNLRDVDPSRIIVVGDIHGDLDKLRRLLVRHGVEDGGGLGVGGFGHWTAEPGTVLVQLGDAIDRGPKDIETLVYLRCLEIEASRRGGQVVRILGNHELLNALGELRFVALESFEESCDPPAFLGLPPLTRTPRTLDEKAEARREIFTPGKGWAARDILGSSCRAACKIGSTVFVHANLVNIGEAASEEALDTLNRDLQDWLRTGSDFRPEPLMERTAFFFDRSSSRPAQAPLLPAAYAETGDRLAKLGAKRLCVGHTPQMGLGINCAPAKGGAEVWRCDTGMCEAFREFGGGVPEALELLDDGRVANVLTMEGSIPASMRMV